MWSYYRNLGVHGHFSWVLLNVVLRRWCLFLRAFDPKHTINVRFSLYVFLREFLSTVSWSMEVIKANKFLIVGS